MSDDSQRGYLFGILQRGARPVGRANHGRGVSSGHGALEYSNTVNYESAPPTVDRVSESSTPTEIRANTQSQHQTKQVVDPQRLPSTSHPPTHAADTSPEKRARSVSLSQPDTKPIDSSSHQVKLTVPEATSESFWTTELNTVAQSVKQSKRVPDAQRGQSTLPSPIRAADTSQEKPTAAHSQSVSVSQPDTKPIGSSSDQVKPITADTSTELSSPLELTVSNETLIQTKQVATSQRLHSKPHSPSRAADTSREKPLERLMSPSTGPITILQPGSQPTDSTVRPATFSAAEFEASLLPIADPVHTTIRPAIADRWSSEPRLPRLTVIEQGGKTISPDNSSPETNQARRNVVVEETGEFLESPRFADPRTSDRGRPSTQPRSIQASSSRSSVQSDRTPTQDARIINRETSSSRAVSREDQAATSLKIDLSESIETVKSLPRAVTLKERFVSPTNAALSESLQREASQSVLAVAPEDTTEAPVARFRVRPADSITERTKVVPAHAETTKDSLVWRGSISAQAVQAEDQYSRGPFIPQQQRAASTAKLTINRIDIQIVNQSPAPSAPLPTAPAPAVSRLPSDSWENLERHQLGHLDLMF